MSVSKLFRIPKATSSNKPLDQMDDSELRIFCFDMMSELEYIVNSEVAPRQKELQDIQNTKIIPLQNKITEANEILKSKYNAPN